MEDYVTFLDVFAPYLFFRLPWKPCDHKVRDMFNRQWSALRQAILCCLRPGDSDLITTVAKYRDLITKYADAAYEVCLHQTSPI